MSILANNAKLIKVGQEYSAGSGISIDDYVISVTGEFGQTYSAGDNIGIYTQDNQLYISGKDWEQDIANASANAYEKAIAEIPEPFNPDYISAQIDNKLNSSDFTDWQNGQYTTDLQTIEGQINNKLDSSSFSDVSGNFLTAINIPESATWNETSNVVKESSANWDNTSDVVKESSASWNQGKTYEGISPIVVNNDENIVSADTWTFSAGSNVSFVDDNVNKITRIDVELPTPQDLSYISAQVDSANQGVDYLSGVVITALPSDMATTGDVAELAQTISETYYPNTNPSSFVNEDWVTAQGYITGVDLSEYAKRDFVLSSVESVASGKLDVSSFASVSSDFLTTSFDIPESATWNNVSETVQTNSAQWAEGGSGDEEVNELVHTNSATWNTVTDKLDTSAQVISSCQKGLFFNGIYYETLVSGLNGYVVSAEYAGVADKARYDYNGNNLADDHNSLTALNNYVQTNSAQWAEGGGGGNPEVESYVQTNSGTIDETTNVVQSNSAQWSQSGTTYTSPSGTILIDGDKLEGTNSAISYSDGFISALTFEHVVHIPENNDVKYYEFNLPAGKVADLAYRYWSDYAQQYTTGIVRAINYSQGDTIVRYPALSADYYGEPSMSGNLVRITATPPNNTTAISAFGKIPSVVELALKSDLPTYEYDNTNKISAINGSALAGGDEFPASANEAITAYQNNSATYLTAHQAISAEEWNDCYDNVNTNSGAWGGSALPISAGPGIKVNLVDNTLVFSNDETVLFEDSNGHTGAFTSTEPFTNFNEVSLYVTPGTGPGVCVNKIILPMIGNNTTGLHFAFDTTWLGFKNISFSFNYNNTGMSAFSPVSGSWFGWNNNGATQDNWASGSMYIYKVVGINRKQ